jgi:hypothetical protein
VRVRTSKHLEENLVLSNSSDSGNSTNILANAIIGSRNTRAEAMIDPMTKGVTMVAAINMSVAMKNVTLNKRILIVDVRATTITGMMTIAGLLTGLVGIRMGMCQQIGASQRDFAYRHAPLQPFVSRGAAD